MGEVALVTVVGKGTGELSVMTVLQRSRVAARMSRKRLGGRTRRLTQADWLSNWEGCG